ncbi:PD-(D/E)XK nuclease family protein [Paraburkholderia caribensis]|uniref:PDDEXK-like family protein n=1 Tax=Paraburkholderia caribensis TaxID=75105 RepID=UPI001CC58BE8|nr:PD-(D/E)XK nuclease family protein [Paraburkholderia caribensis]
MSDQLVNLPEISNDLTASVRDFLTSIHGRLAGLRSARAAYARRLAPEFNVLSLLRPDEIRLSSVFAELLDPAGSHAQGRGFWELFVEVFRCPEWARNAQQIKVRTEVGTDALERSERRIDIVIELDGTAAVAIENKPWAIDQDRQVADYLAHLKRRYAGKHVLIYLAPDGRSPVENSIAAGERDRAESDGTLRNVGFSELLPWLRACRNASEASNVASFLGEVEQYIRQQFVGIQDMTEVEALIGEVTRNAATIEAAFEIARAVSAVKQKLLGDLEVQLRKLLAESDRMWILTADTVWASKYQGFSIQFNPRDRYVLRFQFEQSDCRQFFFGIKKNPTDQHPEDVRDALDREFGFKSKKTENWTWYQDFEAPFWDWTLTPTPLQQIASGEMAEMIVSRVERVYRRLDAENLLSQLKIAA